MPDFYDEALNLSSANKGFPALVNKTKKMVEDGILKNILAKSHIFLEILLSVQILFQIP
jgi:hypothetical protein